MEAPAKPVEVIQEPVYTLDFRVTATKEQLDLLKGIFATEQYYIWSSANIERRIIMAVQNSLAKKQKMGMAAYLTQDAVKKQINSVVGGKNGTRFISSIVSAVQTTPALQECSNPSNFICCTFRRGIEPFALATAWPVLHGSFR